MDTIEIHGAYALSTFSMLIANLVAMNGRNKEFVRRNRVVDEFSFINLPLRRKMLEEEEWEMKEMKTGMPPFLPLHLTVHSAASTFFLHSYYPLPACPPSTITPNRAFL